MSSKNIYGPAPGGGGSGGTYEGVRKPDDVFDAELSSEMVKRTDKLNDTTIDLAVRLKQAREFMAWSCSHLRGSWMDWMDEANRAVKDIVQLRMSFDRESKSIIASGKDVRDFYNSPEYAQAHAMLKESMALIERFAALKQDGTLDALAEFILKVSCKA
jgi:hypothetical protein